MTRRLLVAAGVYLVVGLGLSGLSHVLDGWLRTETGLRQTVALGVDGTAVQTRTTPDIDLSFLDDDPDLPRQFFEVRWDGVWHVPEARQLLLGGSKLEGRSLRGEGSHDAWAVLEADGEASPDAPYRSRRNSQVAAMLDGLADQVGSAD